MIGKDCCHSHVALELSKSSSLTVGFNSSGSMEAIALGTAYSSIGMTVFPKEFYGC